MRCPKCVNTVHFKLTTKLAVDTEIACTQRGTEVTKVTVKETYKDAEPDKIECCSCQHEGPPEKFKYFTEEQLKERVETLLADCVEQDDLISFPEKVMDLLF